MLLSFFLQVDYSAVDCAQLPQCNVVPQSTSWPQEGAPWPGGDQPAAGGAAVGSGGLHDSLE